MIINHLIFGSDSIAFDIKNVLLKIFHLHFASYLELTPFRILSQTDKHGIVWWNGTTFIENRRVAGNSGTLSLPIGWLSLIISSKGPQSLVFLVKFLPTIIFPHLHIQIFLFFITPTVILFPLLHSVYYLPLRHICFLPKYGGQGQPFQCWYLKLCWTAGSETWPTSHYCQWSRSPSRGTARPWPTPSWQLHL